MKSPNQFLQSRLEEIESELNRVQSIHLSEFSKQSFLDFERNKKQDCNELEKLVAQYKRAIKVLTIQNIN